MHYVQLPDGVVEGDNGVAGELVGDQDQGLRPVYYSRHPAGDSPQILNRCLTVDPVVQLNDICHDVGRVPLPDSKIIFQDPLFQEII